MILNANNPASWGQHYLINNQAKPCCWLLVALSVFTWNAGEATEMKHWAASKAMCGFIAAVGLDMRNNSVAEQSHGRDPNLLQSPWALSQLSLVTKGLINCFNLLCSFFLLFPHPFWTFFLHRILKTDLLISHPVGWSKIFCVSFTSHEAAVSGGCTEILPSVQSTQHLGQQNPESWLWQPGIIILECVIIAIKHLFWFSSKY